MITDDVIMAIHKVTKASYQLIGDVRATMQKGIDPLPGTVQHSIWLCWQLIDELGLVND